MLALAYGMPSLVRIGMSAGLPIEPSEPLLGLLARAVEDPPTDDRHAARSTWPRWTGSTRSCPFPRTDREVAGGRYAWVRSGYDQALRGLAGLTMAPAAEWTTDRPAKVGRPRSVLSRPIDVDWEPNAATYGPAPDGPAPDGPAPDGPAPDLMTAEGRASDGEHPKAEHVERLSPTCCRQTADNRWANRPLTGAGYRWLNPPASSLVMATVTGCLRSGRWTAGGR